MRDGPADQPCFFSAVRMRSCAQCGPLLRQAMNAEAVLGLAPASPRLCPAGCRLAGPLGTHPALSWQRAGGAQGWHRAGGRFSETRGVSATHTEGSHGDVGARVPTPQWVTQRVPHLSPAASNIPVPITEPASFLQGCCQACVRPSPGSAAPPDQQAPRPECWGVCRWFPRRWHPQPQTQPQRWAG